MQAQAAATQAAPRHKKRRELQRAAAKPKRGQPFGGQLATRLKGMSGPQLGAAGQRRQAGLQGYGGPQAGGWGRGQSPMPHGATGWYGGRHYTGGMSDQARAGMDRGYPMGMGGGPQPIGQQPTGPRPFVGGGGPQQFGGQYMPPGRPGPEMFQGGQLQGGGGGGGGWQPFQPSGGGGGRSYFQPGRQGPGQWSYGGPSQWGGSAFGHGPPGTYGSGLDYQPTPYSSGPGVDIARNLGQEQAMMNRMPSRVRQQYGFNQAAGQLGFDPNTLPGYGESWGPGQWTSNYGTVPWQGSWRPGRAANTGNGNWMDRFRSRF